MTKCRVSLIIAAIMFAVLGSIAVAFAQSKAWEWTLEKENFRMLSYFTRVKVDATCDGPNRVYIARALTGDSIAMSVVKDGCVRQPAEAPRAD